MSDWTAADLDRIGSATELEITTRRADGSLRPYVPIWVVRVGGQLFVRSWRGQAATVRLRPADRYRKENHQMTDTPPAKDNGATEVFRN